MILIIKNSWFFLNFFCCKIVTRRVIFDMFHSWLLIFFFIFFIWLNNNITLFLTFLVLVVTRLSSIFKCIFQARQLLVCKLSSSLRHIQQDEGILVKVLLISLLQELEKYEVWYQQEPQELQKEVKKSRNLKWSELVARRFEFEEKTSNHSWEH